jgi:two-component system OmpR family response regulator
MKRLLVVDDDKALRKLLGDYLGENGYEVALVSDGEAMRLELARTAFDLIILDLMLPGADGLTLCRDMRARSKVPILMLTARGDELDRIIGLEMGADDYLAKPFNPRELLARIKNILRRTQDGANAAAAPRLLIFAGWTLDLSARHLIDSDGVVSPLSNGEFKLLQVLAEHPRKILSRDQLTDVLSGREALPYDRTIDVMISRLRRSLRDDARDPLLIKTIRNEGYMLSAPVEQQT